jgi:VanZ family protein
VRPVFFYKPHQRPTGADWRWWLNVWAPVAVAVTVICVESTGTFSAQNTSNWLRPIFERIFGAFQDAAWDVFHHYLRKTGHFIGYGIVCLTFLRAWLYTLDLRAQRDLLAWRTLSAWRIRSSLLAILSTAIVAAGDEFHQTFLPGRTGTPTDVLLDTAGACAMCLLVWLTCWSRRLVR